MEYALYANELYSDENVKVENVLVSAAVDVVNPGQIQTTKAVLNVKAPGNGRQSSHIAIRWLLS